MAISRITATVTVQPWVSPFVLLFARLECGRRSLDAVGRFACQHGMHIA